VSSAVTLPPGVRVAAGAGSGAAGAGEGGAAGAGALPSMQAAMLAIAAAQGGGDALA